MNTTDAVKPGSSCLENPVPVIFPRHSSATVESNDDDDTYELYESEFDEKKRNLLNKEELNDLVKDQSLSKKLKF